MMDLIRNLFDALMTAGFIVLVILAVAALFVIVFSIATSLDKRVTQ